MYNSVKDLMVGYGMTATEFSRYFGIPYRTIQNWVYGARECPTYLLELMAYRLRAEFPPIPPSCGQ